MAAGGLALLMIVLFFIFSIIIPFWVYSDAQQNSSYSAVLWALVAFFGGLLGLLLYLLIGRDRTGGRGGNHGGNDGWNDNERSNEPDLRR
ncbi:Phospholipase_D-nuclease N-terminal [Natronoarchaeum philippinense]|uniref:Phospholipase_D-nuclease N-terminal n=1 Tax=Natronoarchaeum philippinense TaxID=558529 RepID=A0A285N900_NATPI|nr:PLDc N-terminal domain-containing protein [Natronoarchaeum philippinense]SNZ04436.1 Phospholipase_D-nuclease N-terminal [Natronoarchaeum philippinense]